MKNLARKAVPASPSAPAGSLAAALAAVPDPRRPYGWRPAYPPLPLVGLLQVMVVAALCGARSLLAMAQWARERRDDAPAVLVALGLPPERSPCVATLHRLGKTLDVAALETAVGAWLEQTLGQPGEALALDGKTLRGSRTADVPAVALVAAYAQQAAAVLAQARIPGEGQEAAAAAAVLAQLVLTGRVVTGDALLTQRPFCRQVLAAGGDYLLPVDQNQPALRDDVAQAFSPLGAGAPR